jgi:elongation factor P
MIKAGQIGKGDCLLWKDEPYIVTEREFVNPGKGAAFVRVKLKNLRSGRVLQETIKTNDSVPEADVYDRDAQYLYADDSAYHFMDAENYDQFTVAREGLEEKINYMKEGDTYRVVMWESTPIDVSVPLKMVLQVTEAAEAVRGDTVTGTTKPVKTETGLEVKVPIFIKEGDKILVNTESGEYVERVNE